MTERGQPRDILFVGSIKVPIDAAKQFQEPLETDDDIKKATKNVFSQVSTALTGRVRRIPDGEVGKRDFFVKWQAEVFAKSPWVCTPAVFAICGIPAPKMEPGLAGSKIELGDPGYDHYARNSYQLFKELKASGVVGPQTRFQVCIPSPLNAIHFFVKPRYLAEVGAAYEQALEACMANIQKAIPHDQLAIQIDCAAEIAHLEGVQTLHNPELVTANSKSDLVDRIKRMAAHVHPDVELGIHLCYGDADHKHFVEPQDTAKLVDFANAITAAIDRPITWFHMPVPKARTDEAYFAALAQLHLQKSVPGLSSGDKLQTPTQLYLGLVHAHDAQGTQERIKVAEKFVPSFGVATECGLGRTPLSDIHSIFDILKDVSEPF